MYLGLAALALLAGLVVGLAAIVTGGFWPKRWATYQRPIIISAAVVAGAGGFQIVWNYAPAAGSAINGSRSTVEGGLSTPPISTTVSPIQSSPNDPTARLRALLSDLAPSQFYSGNMRRLTREVVAASSLDALVAEADAGNPRAQVLLGVIHTNGDFGFEQDLAEAARLYESAAASGFAPAHVHLVPLYSDGRGVPRDPARALRHARIAADFNIPLAQAFAGSLLSSDDGITPDYRMALYYLRAAVSNGEPRAHCHLGLLYDAGEGVPSDERQALEHFRLCADSGFAMGQYLVGTYYEHGRGGVRADRAEAIYWYGLAANQNLEEAREALNRLNDRQL